MSTEPAREQPTPETQRQVQEDSYPALRKAGRVLIGAALAVLLVVYFPALPAMVVHTLIPFVGLTAVGLVLGLLFPRRLFIACFFAWWAVLMAVLLRRSAMSDIPLSTQIYDGALEGYPDWAVWLGQVYRLGAYYLALRLGGGLGRRLRGGKG